MPSGIVFNRMEIPITKLQTLEEQNGSFCPLMSLGAHANLLTRVPSCAHIVKDKFAFTLSIWISVFCTFGNVSMSAAADASTLKVASTASSTSPPQASAAGPSTRSSTTSPDANALAAAQKFYASGDVERAFQVIIPVLKKEPDNATAHYLTANCLLKVGRTTDAAREYYAAESLAPHSKIAEYSRIARTRINAMQTVQAKTSSTIINTADDDDDAANEDDKTSVATNSNATAGTDSFCSVSKMTDAKNVNSKINNSKSTSGNAAVPPGTLELIRKQAVLAKRMAIENGAAEAEAERQKGIYEAKSLQEKAERNAARSAGSNEPITVSPEERERLKAEAGVTGERLKQIGNWKASIVEEWSHEKSDEIQRQAEQLQEQLTDDRPSNMKLNPVGTNLYIRNYAKPPLTPLHAEAKSISTNTAARLSSRQTGLTLHSNATNTNGVVNHRNRTVVTVEGKVLNGH